MALLLGLVPSRLAGQDQIAGHVVTGFGDASPAFLVHGVVSRRAAVLGLQASGAASVWLDTGYPESSLLNVDELALDYMWSWGELRLGLGDLPWGLSDVRSPIAVLVPRGVVWRSWGGPALSRPLIELTFFAGWGNVEFVVLPVRRPFYLGRLVTESWEGLPLRSDGGWERGSDVGVRIWRVWREVDLAISYVEGRDRRPWLRPTALGDAEVHHPRVSQLGYEVQWARGRTVVRSEGSVTRRQREWHRRFLAGVEWFATPYLTVLAEHGFASDRREAASPLVDDLLFSGQLLTETLRIQGTFFIDPRSGNSHASLNVRWTLREVFALEGKILRAPTDHLEEPPLAIRQDSFVRLAIVRYF